MTVPLIRGLRHLALRVKELGRSRAFYEGVFGMKVVWQPDADNVYLSSGTDNLALHQIPAAELSLYATQHGQFLDHFGVIMGTPDSVDQMFDQVHKLVERLGGSIVHRPKRHRDSSYSFYIADPDGNTIQILYEPTISNKT
jgi:catechol 2,3-dioxygenase-like lactoylglutathione lyase family enzyme